MYDRDDVIALLNLIQTEDCEAICSSLERLKKMDRLHELSKAVTENDNSFLHLAVAYHKPEDIKKFVEILGDSILEMHLISNCRGNTPMALTPSIANQTTRKAIQNILLETAIEATQRSINNDPTPLDYTAILAQYHILESSKLAQNIKRGCEAVNYCSRKKIKSYSHPRMNELSLDKYNAMYTQLHHFRDSISNNMDFATYIYCLKSHGYGNCGEYAQLASFYLSNCRKNYNHVLLHVNNFYFLLMNIQADAHLCDPATYGPDASIIYLKDLSFSPTSPLELVSDCSANPNIYAFSGSRAQYCNLNSWQIDSLFNCGQQKMEYTIEIAKIHNGDHNFAVLDGHYGEDFNQYDENTVFVDAWAGKVYPATERTNLMNFYRVYINNRPYNFLAHLNPCFHKLQTFKVFNSTLDNLSTYELYPITLNSTVSTRLKEKFNSHENHTHAMRLTRQTNQLTHSWSNSNHFFNFFSSIEALCDYIRDYEETNPSRKSQNDQHDEIGSNKIFNHAYQSLLGFFKPAPPSAAPVANKKHVSQFKH